MGLYKNFKVDIFSVVLFKNRKSNKMHIFRIFLVKHVFLNHLIMGSFSHGRLLSNKNYSSFFKGA